MNSIKIVDLHPTHLFDLTSDSFFGKKIKSTKKYKKEVRNITENKTKINSEILPKIISEEFCKNKNLELLKISNISNLSTEKYSSNDLTFENKKCEKNDFYILNLTVLDNFDILNERKLEKDDTNKIFNVKDCNYKEDIMENDTVDLNISLISNKSNNISNLNSDNKIKSLSESKIYGLTINEIPKNINKNSFLECDFSLIKNENSSIIKSNNEFIENSKLAVNVREKTSKLKKSNNEISFLDIDNSYISDYNCKKNSVWSLLYIPYKGYHIV
ncbi:hypothetical protein GVAV_003430 [Gurleya vavrai]